MTIGTQITPRKHIIVPRIIKAKTLSKTSTSLPNRFRIRPLGVVSKKLIGERIMLYKIPKWRFLAALRTPLYRDMEAAIVKTPETKQVSNMLHIGH